MTSSARVARFRAGVYGSRDLIGAGCQVLLLRLSDDMNTKCIVSIPRSKLADEFGCPPARITEWVKQARAAGFLDVVRRGRPGITAVYQGLYVAPRVVRHGVPTEVREGVPSTWYGSRNQAEVRQGVPPMTGPEVRPHLTQVGNGSLYRNGHLNSPPPRGSYEEGA